MTKNKELETFYQAVYLKGEKKHFTPFLAKGNTSTEAQEVINEIDWDDKTVLDVGCGTGNFANAVAKKGAKHVLGIDFAEEAIRIAKKRYIEASKKKIDNNVSYHQSLSEIPDNLDFAIIATTANVRRPVIENLLTKKPLDTFYLKRSYFKIQKIFLILETLFII